MNTYLTFGIEHILRGFDHLLFVTCLIFTASTWRRILATISGLTLANSFTLTLAGLELAPTPIPPIEATIALLAREIALDRRDTRTLQHPIAASTIFSLLHGLGLASALAGTGLPQTEIPAALLAFSVGVALGQVVFVVSVFFIFQLMTQGVKS